MGNVNGIGIDILQNGCEVRTLIKKLSDGTVRVVKTSPMHAPGNWESKGIEKAEKEK